MEYFFTCPYCWQKISMILNSEEEISAYIEDCEVCCRPIELSFQFLGDTIIRFDVVKVEGI